MTTRSLINISALGAFVAVSSLYLGTVQAAGTDRVVVAQADSSASTGGSAGDGDKPLTYTKRNFGDIDLNHDGIVDKKEAAGSKVDGTLLKKMDTNGDGQLSQTEFDSYMATQPLTGPSTKTTR